MKDEDLEAFVVAIERHFSTKSGKQHVLSPRDFALARGWHAAGVPLATVLAGVDRVMARERDVASLRYCRRSVEALASAAQRSEVPGAGAPPPQDMVARLEALRSAIGGISQPALFDRPGRRLAELLDLAAVARKPNWGYLRSKLEELDTLVDAAALEALAPAELASLRAEATAVAARGAGEGGRATLEDARQHYLRRRARERFALPRVSGD
jgi:hypothetical protein